jgi:CheY-like chemotaxis protein
MSAEEKRRVLVVDDDDLLRGFYTRVLESQGFAVVCAPNGDDAVDIIEKGDEQFSLIIADLLMPGRTGWEVIEFIKCRETMKEIPIIAVTGLAGSLDEFEKIETTCDAVLHKGDFDLQAFLQVIHRLVNKGA